MQSGSISARAILCTYCKILQLRESSGSFLLMEGQALREFITCIQICARSLKLPTGSSTPMQIDFSVQCIAHMYAACAVMCFSLCTTCITFCRLLPLAICFVQEVTHSEGQLVSHAALQTAHDVHVRYQQGAQRIMQLARAWRSENRYTGRADFSQCSSLAAFVSEITRGKLSLPGGDSWASSIKGYAALQSRGAVWSFMQPYYGPACRSTACKHATKLGGFFLYVTFAAVLGSLTWQAVFAAAARTKHTMLLVKRWCDPKLAVFLMKTLNSESAPRMQLTCDICIAI